MLLLYSDIDSPRVDYIFKLVFTELLGLPFEQTRQKELFKNHAGPTLGYSASRVNNEFFICCTNFLKPGPVLPFEVPVAAGEQIHLFPTDGSDLPFDVFAAVFYMVSRYEEYLPFVPDQHGRFTSSSSLASKHNFVLKPVVNEWVAQLRVLLAAKFPDLSFPSRHFSALVTYDIDVAYEFKGRSFLKNTLSLGKDLLTFNFKRVKERQAVLNGTTTDSWDTYGYIINTIKQYNLEAIFFFLVGRYSAQNKNLAATSTPMKELIRKIAALCSIGIHPSYSSSLNPRMLIAEKETLETVAGKPIKASRQHFLKFTLPHTYRYLIDAGITEDHSMGYADTPGFRAGICSPYYFYDLTMERATNLKIYPITCMEGNFVKYMKISPGESIAMINDLLLRIQAVNGLFISLWHNHTLSDKDLYKGWKKVHEEMIKKIVLLKEDKPPQ